MSAPALDDFGISQLFSELRDLLLAGGRVSAILVAIVLFLAWRLARRRTEAAVLRRELHGSRVRGGYVAEALAPLAEGFPVEIGKPGTTTVFLGQPVDYVHFDPDEGVTFIEIKSGRSTLSTPQRRLRERVESGAVLWREMRVETDDRVSRARRE